jgi:hypothetical protein
VTGLERQKTLSTVKSALVSMLPCQQFQCALTRPEDFPPGMVVECAAASGSRYSVTHKVRDFRRVTELGIQPVLARVAGCA